MGNRNFAVDEVYHIYNRGVMKRKIFLDQRDWVRFLFIILYFQSTTTVSNVSYYITSYIKHRMFNIRPSTKNKTTDKHLVKLHVFALLPNHFHLLVEEVVEGGISKYMQRVANAYTKYFNTKYKESGHLFQNSFKSVHIEDNEQLLYVSSYIHLNCRDDRKWKKREHLYPWSSYQDYIKDNRWPDLLETKLILDQFKSPSDYRETVDSSDAKNKTDPD
ncbi:MAG: transposase [bacterium]|nr:transposase [bacterium]